MVEPGEDVLDPHSDERDEARARGRALERRVEDGVLRVKDVVDRRVAGLRAHDVAVTRGERREELHLDRDAGERARAGPVRVEDHPVRFRRRRSVERWRARRAVAAHVEAREHGRCVEGRGRRRQLGAREREHRADLAAGDPVLAARHADDVRLRGPREKGEQRERRQRPQRESPHPGHAAAYQRTAPRTTASGSSTRPGFRRRAPRSRGSGLPRWACAPPRTRCRWRRCCTPRRSLRTCRSSRRTRRSGRRRTTG